MENGLPHAALCESRLRTTSTNRRVMTVGEGVKHSLSAHTFHRSIRSRHAMCLNPQRLIDCTRNSAVWEAGNRSRFLASSGLDRSGSSHTYTQCSAQNKDDAHHARQGRHSWRIPDRHEEAACAVERIELSHLDIHTSAETVIADFGHYVLTLRWGIGALVVPLRHAG